LSLPCALHLLTAPEQIEFKLAVQVYRCLTAASYLADDFQHQSSNIESRQRLRSALSSSLVDVVRRTCLSTISN